MKITPGFGVGEIELGWTRQDARRRLGEPERSDRVAVDGTEWVEWHYDSRAFSLYFDGDEDFRLVTIDVDDPDIELEGYRPIGATEAEVLETLGRLGELVLEDELADGDRKVYELVGTEIWLWFSEGQCDSVQVSAFIDDDDDDELEA